MGVLSARADRARLEADAWEGSHWGQSPRQPTFSGGSGGGQQRYFVSFFPIRPRLPPAAPTELLRAPQSNSRNRASWARNVWEALCDGASLVGRWRVARSPFLVVAGL